MSAKTVTRAIKDVLQDLSESKFKEFCDAILDRRDEPRVRIADLEGKSRVEVGNTLVSIYTEHVARDVVLQALGEIRCNAERESFAKDTGEGLLTCNTKIMKVETTGASMQTAKQSNLVFTAKDTGEGLLTCDITMMETTGASMQTAKQDNLQCTGLSASHAMADRDLEEMDNYKTIIKNVGHQKGVDPALIAAIISRSSRAGKMLKEGKGCFNEKRQEYDTFGLMQIDVNPEGGGHTPKGSWDSEEHLCQATDILIYFITRIRDKFPKWSKEKQLKGGIAAYNAGDSNIVPNQDVDSRTTNGDYSNDVIARAQWYKLKGGF